MARFSRRRSHGSQVSREAHKESSKEAAEGSQVCSSSTKRLEGQEESRSWQEVSRWRRGRSRDRLLERVILPLV